MPGLESILRNPRRLRQFAETPGNYAAALDYASQGSVARRPASRSYASKKAEEPNTLETGEVIEQISLPDGSLVRPATESGKLVKVPGKSNLYLDPTTGEPYQPDPTKPTGLRSAYETARQVKRDGKVFASISGVGEREIGVDPKVAEDATKAAAKREAENRRLALDREKRPYQMNRITGEPIPRQTDEEWAALKQAKAAKLDEAARVKRLKDQADVIDLEADRISLTAPKPAKEDEEAFSAAESALSQFAAGQDMEEVATKYAGAPATDEASQQAKAAAENYLAYKDKVKPAKEAEKKVQELKLRALDIKEQIINPQKWKEGKTASLAALPDGDLVAEVKAQADIINDTEAEAVGTLDFITKGRNKIVEEINAFQEERQLQSEQGLNAEELEALNLQQARLEQSLADYDEHNSEAKAESDAALKAAADRRDVLAVAGTELEGRAAKQAEAAGQAKAKAETLAKAKPLYEGWAKGLYSDDWRTEEETPRLAQEAAKAGLDVEQAKEALQTYRQLDWSNPRRDAQTAKPISEAARLLPNGEVTVNPSNLLDPEAYDAAVDAMDTTPEAKGRAKAMRADLAVPVAEEAYNNLRKNSDFAAWLDENTTGTPLERMEKFNAEMKAGGALNASLMKFFGSAAGLPSGWLGTVAGLTGSDKALEYARFWQDRAQAYSTAAGEAGKGTNMAGRFMASVAGGLPSVMESMAAGGVARRVLGSGAVALGVAATDAMAQSGGNTYVEAVDAYLQQGLSPEEAKAKAAAPAIASGLVTGVLTALGGGGVESLLRTEGRELAKSAIKRGLKTMVAREVVEGTSEEALEEWSDQLLQGVIAQVSYNPNKPMEQVLAEAVEAGLVGGVLGGGVSGIRAYGDAKNGEASPPPDPATIEGGSGTEIINTDLGNIPEGSELVYDDTGKLTGWKAPGPAMPVQPRPAGPAPTPAPATPQDVTEQIAKFNPTGATPLPQSVAATAKRTGRPPAAVARQAASGVVKIAQGQSLESLDIEEQEALGFVNKGGKITPDTKVTPLVYLYKDKPVLRNAAAEWLTDEAQEGLAGMINLTEAERKAQIDAEEAAAKAPAAKKKAGQAKPASAESKSQVSGAATTGGSLPSTAGSSPAPATTPTPAPANEPQPQTAVSPEPSKATEPSPGEALKEFQQKLNTHWEKPSSKEEAWQLAVDSPQGNWVEDGTGARARKTKRRTTQLGRDQIEFESQLWNDETQMWEDNPNGYSSITLRPDGTITGDLPEAWKPGSYTEATGKRVQTKPTVTTNEPETVLLPTDSQPETGPTSKDVPVDVEQPPAQAPQTAPEPAPAATPATPEPSLTPKQADQMARAQAEYDSAMRSANADPEPEIREKKKKTAGMRFSAIKRQITGKLTAKEAENKAKREASNYEGKAVSVDGKNAEVIGNAFGKVKVKFTDGTKAAVPAAKIKPPVEAGPAPEAEAPPAPEPAQAGPEEASTPPASPARSPSPNLPPRSNKQVPARPPKNGRDTAARDKWDEEHGDMRKGGRTHNNDGSPYQPTVYDETVAKVVPALKDATFEESLEAIGSDKGAELGSSIEKLLNDGWVWNPESNKMVDPQNRGETPIEAIQRIDGISRASATPAPAQASQKEASQPAPAKEPAPSPALALDHPAIKPHMQPKHQARVRALAAQGVQVVTVETEEDAAKVLGVPLKRKGNRGVTAIVNGKPVVIFIAKNFTGKKGGGAVITEELHHAAALVVLQQNPQLLNEALAEVDGLKNGTAIYSQWDNLSPLGKLIEAAAAYASGKWNPDGSSPVKRMVDAILEAISKAFGLDAKQSKTATAKAIRSLADSADALMATEQATKEPAPSPAPASQPAGQAEAKPAKALTEQDVAPLPFTKGEPVGTVGFRRVDEAQVVQRYYVAKTPPESTEADFAPFSVWVESHYDTGEVITNLWSKARSIEEADSIVANKTKNSALKVERRTNNTAGWTQTSAEIEAKKLNSKDSDREWVAIDGKGVYGRGRWVLEGRLKTAPPHPPPRFQRCPTPRLFFTQTRRRPRGSSTSRSAGQPAGSAHVRPTATPSLSGSGSSAAMRGSRECSRGPSMSMRRPPGGWSPRRGCSMPPRRHPTATGWGGSRRRGQPAGLRTRHRPGPPRPCSPRQAAARCAACGGRRVATRGAIGGPRLARSTCPDSARSGRRGTRVRPSRRPPARRSSSSQGVGLVPDSTRRPSCA